MNRPGCNDNQQGRVMQTISSGRSPASTHTTKAVLLMVLLAPALAAADEERDEMVRAGDLLQIGIPAIGYGLTYLLETRHAPDPSGLRNPQLEPDSLRLKGDARHDFVAAALRVELATYSLKYSVDEQRPNGGGQSFPSGHTSMAFMGAEFIRKQYGWGWGVPAYLGASFVGWTRVWSGNHWTRDVVAGAAIGICGNHDAAEFSLGLGTLSVRPALMFVSPGPLTAAEDEREWQAPITGLRFELTFPSR